MTTANQTTDFAAKRAALYVRVSSEEQVEGYSLDAQDRAGRLYCEVHGWTIERVYRDEGKSARTEDITKRPAFAQMIADAEAGFFDVVIVHKLDRFARNLLVALETLQRLKGSEVDFVSIMEQMDFTSPIGKVVLANLLAFAQYYSDNLSFETRKGKTERKRQGLYNGLLPFGTTKGLGDIPVLDMQPKYCIVATRQEIVPAEGLKFAFALAAAGRTDREIAQTLSKTGYLTSGNRGQNAFTKDTVRAMLQNRFYLGELPDSTGNWLPGKHGTLIDPALFEAAQKARIRNTRKPVRQGRAYRPWGLSGLATCAECGNSIIVHGRPDGRKRVRCAGRAQGKGCTQPTFFAEVAEEQMTDYLANFALPAAKLDRLVSAWRRHRQRDVSAVAERARLEAKVRRLREVYLDGDLDSAEYQTRKGEIERHLAALPEETTDDEEASRRLAARLAELSRTWGVATPEERNRIARSLFAEVVIENKTAVAVVPRPEMRPFFAASAVNGVSAEATGIGLAAAFFCPVHSLSRRRHRAGERALQGETPTICLVRANLVPTNDMRSFRRPPIARCGSWPPSSASAMRLFAE